MFTALLLLAISCKKENSAFPSSGTTNETVIQDLSAEAKELAGVYAVKIGTQVWKIKNLAATRYRNGDLIPYVATPAKWRSLTTGAWC